MGRYTLHNYYRSSASFRVRIALNLTGIEYEYRSYHLRKNEHRSDSFLNINSQGLVPVLELPSGDCVNQSLAIIEWLHDTYPAADLLPEEPLQSVRVRSLSQIIACDVHPINNLRVLGYLENQLGANDAHVVDWFQHWVHEGFTSLESRLKSDGWTGRYCHGDTPTLADITLVPQVFNNRRFSVDMAEYPTIMRIFDTCMEHPAFYNAQPELQPDNEKL